jgi:hypothetical protein
MATCTPLVSTPSTANATSYASGSFTPSVGDLLVMLVATSGSIEPAALGDLTDNQGGTYHKCAFSLRSGSASSNYIFIRNQLAIAAVGHIATFTCLGDPATGAHILGYGVSGLTRTGYNAKRQSAVQSNQGAGTTPAPAFAIAALTGNPCIGMVGNAQNPAGVTPPAGWTEPVSPLFDTGATTPAAGIEGCHINSGFTGTTVTWGSTSAGAHGSIVLELDTSPPAVGARQVIMILRQAIKRASLI